METKTIKTYHYLGYLALGASNKEEAKQKQGMQICLTKKPNLFRRLMFLLFLRVYWVDEIKDE